ncbi:hypothetical protein F5Y18DRAFT_108562 [Xylariaceae sp. FL1019]|nr:hypothetical protein F5Y18DRAFT_108562 [Xylariaceae sp. FL1019]
MSQSGAGIAEECILKFNELKLNKKWKYVIYKLSDDNKQFVVEDAGEASGSDAEANWEVLKEKLLAAKTKSKTKQGRLHLLGSRLCRCHGQDGVRLVQAGSPALIQRHRRRHQGCRQRGTRVPSSIEAGRQKRHLSASTWTYCMGVSKRHSTKRHEDDQGLASLGPRR